MASPHVAIAKASLAAALFRADITVINRDSIAELHKLLENLISTCSAANIQKCKNWLLQNVVPSPTRTGALGKYLASLAKHLQQDAKRGTDGRKEGDKLSVSRKRLHIFYLLNDLLHHVKYHSQNASLFSTFCGSLQPSLLDLTQSTALNCKAKVRARMSELLGLWKEEKYYPSDYIIKLREALDTTPGFANPKALSTNIKTPKPAPKTKELPFIMPSTHGDPSMPYFDLPAGNLMPHIMPNSSVAITPDQVRVLQFVPGPADDGLVHALKDFLKEVENINNSAHSDEGAIVRDIDDLGQISYQDDNGEIVDGDTYYGWSRTFCEKMKKRRQDDGSRQGRARSYSSGRSSSRSRSRSRSPRKRRRYSDSISSRSASRSRSSRSPSPRNGRRNGSYRRRISHDRGQQSTSRSYSPEQPNPLPAASLSRANSQRGFASQPSPSTITQNQPPLFNIPPNQVPFQPPLGPGGLPLPPPLPPNYSGPWPPNIGFPPGLPFPAPPLEQAGTYPPHPGPPRSNPNWSSGNWRGPS